MAGEPETASFLQSFLHELITKFSDKYDALVTTKGHHRKSSESLGFSGALHWREILVKLYREAIFRIADVSLVVVPPQSVHFLRNARLKQVINIRPRPV